MGIDQVQAARDIVPVASVQNRTAWPIGLGSASWITARARASRSCRGPGRGAARRGWRRAGGDRAPPPGHAGPDRPGLAVATLPGDAADPRHLLGRAPGGTWPPGDSADQRRVPQRTRCEPGRWTDRHRPGPARLIIGRFAGSPGREEPVAATWSMPGAGRHRRRGRHDCTAPRRRDAPACRRPPARSAPVLSSGSDPPGRRRDDRLAAARVGVRDRSGGHCFVGRSVSRGLIIDVTPMGSVSVSGDVAVVGAGACLGGVYESFNSRAWPFPPGRVPRSEWPA